MQRKQVYRYSSDINLLHTALLQHRLEEYLLDILYELVMGGVSRYVLIDVLNTYRCSCLIRTGYSDVIGRVLISLGVPEEQRRV